MPTILEAVHPMEDLSFLRKSIRKRIPGHLIWLVAFLLLLIPIWQAQQSDRWCHHMGVDFRGYYASAQIALDHGFAQVYDQNLQRDYQATLLYRCSTPPSGPPLYVAMPYLPVFVVLFLPFALLDFTTSFYCWIGLQVLLFAFSLYRLTRAYGLKVDTTHLLQWGFCIPLISNLYLGQINAFLAVLFVEFLLAFSQERDFRSGLWLSALLIKPHLLILLLPGLVWRRRWRLLAGFVSGTSILLASAIALVRFQGLKAILEVTTLFTGPLIQTVNGMMNFRALALNLSAILPAWVSWSLAGLGALFILALAIRAWFLSDISSPDAKIRLVVITLLATFLLSWHSHFYMLMLLPPMLLYLDIKGLLPGRLRFAWALAPPLVYLAVSWLNPILGRALFGLSMLVLNIFMIKFLWPGLTVPIDIGELPGPNGTPAA